MAEERRQSGEDTSRELAKARVGTTVRAKWRLDRLIGFGGMAAVYAATHESGRKAALKIMHAELCRDDEIRERFLREGQIARKVDHPGVLKIFDDDVTEHGEPFLIMELLVGHTLSRVWRHHNKKLGVEASLNIAARVLSALATFHEHGIVHRDLKPGNIFITRQSEVKVLDFGVAQFREKGRDMTRVGLAMGTPAYMAPEQALGKSESVDHRADIYAVGATLYSLLSGKRLHRGATEQESHVLAATQPAPSVARVAPDLPIAVVTIIDKALQWDPRNRWQTADEMREVIERILMGEQVASEPAPESGGVEFELDVEESSMPSGVAGLRGGHDSDISDADSFSSGSAFNRRQSPSDGAPIELAFEPPRQDARGRRRVVPAVVAKKRTPPPMAVVKRIAQQQAASDEVPLEPSHPLAPMFVSLDRLLRTARQYGPAHPETQSRLEPAFSNTFEALKDMPGGIHFKVLPFCFSVQQQPVWEPAPPGDIVPYTLSVAGLREVQIQDGVNEDELRELFGAMMIDANSNPSEIATALWEAPFSHVQCRIEEELGGEDAQSLEDFFSEAAELERELQMQLSDVQKMALQMQRADVMEAAALASMRERSKANAPLLALDDESHERLASEMRPDTSDLRQRHDYMLLDAYSDAAHRRDLAALLEAVGAYSRRLVRLGRDDELYDTHRALLEGMGGSRTLTSKLTPAFVTASLFPSDVLMHVVRTASGWSDLIAEDQKARALKGFAWITKSMGQKSLPAFLKLADRVGEGQLVDHILDYVVRVSEGEEELVLAHLDAMNPITAQMILGRMVAHGSPTLKPKLAPLLDSPNSALRCEALALLASSHAELTQELMQLFASDDPAIRQAALDTFVRHRVVSAGPALVGIVEQDSFADRALDEQQRVFQAIWTLNPPRGESLQSGLVSKHGLLVDKRNEHTRVLCARMLGEMASSDLALEALEGAAARRPWNSRPLREVAKLAADQVRTRMVGGRA